MVAEFAGRLAQDNAKQEVRLLGCHDEQLRTRELLHTATPMINPRPPNARRHAQVQSHQSQQSHPSRDPMRWLLEGGVHVG